MYCKQCGKEHTGKITFCAYCGAKQDVEELTNAKEEQEKIVGRKKNNIVIPICLFSVAVIALMGITTINMCAPKRHLQAYADAILGKQWTEAYQYLFTEENEELPEDNYVDFAEELLEDVSSYEIKKVSKTQKGFSYKITFLDADGQIVLEEQLEIVKKKDKRMMVFSEWGLAENAEDNKWLETLIELNRERMWKDTYYEFVRCVFDNQDNWEALLQKYKYLEEELKVFYDGNYSVLSEENEYAPATVYFKLLYINDDDIPELAIACRDMTMLLRYDENEQRLVPIYWKEKTENILLVDTYSFGLVEYTGEGEQMLGDFEIGYRMQLYEYDGTNMILTDTIEYENEDGKIPSEVKEYYQSVTQFGRYLWYLTEDNINKTLKYDFLDADVKLANGKIEVEEEKEKEQIDIGVMYRELNQSSTYGSKTLVREQIDMRYHLQFKDIWGEPESYGYYDGVEVWGEMGETGIRYINQKLDGIALFGLYPGMDATNVGEILGEYGFTYNAEFELYRDGEDFGDTSLGVEIEDGTIRSIYMYFIE